MIEFWFYIKLGLSHVLDVNAYDHVLFFAALTIPYIYKDWKRVVTLATVFTIGHSVSLVLSVFKVLNFDPIIIEFLIPVTIGVTAIYNVMFFGMGNKSGSLSLNMVLALFFGLVHGFGFSNYFKMIIADAEDKLMPLFGFAIGIEFSQIIIVALVLLFAFILLDMIKLKRRYWIIGSSVLILAIVIPMLVDTLPF